MAQRRKPVTIAEVNKKGLTNVVAELENQERNRTAIMSAQPNIPQTGSYRASQEAPKTKQVPKFVMKTMVPDTQSVKDSVDRIAPENAQPSVSSTRKDLKEVKAVQGYEAEQKRRQEEDSILRADIAELESWPER